MRSSQDEDGSNRQRVNSFPQGDIQNADESTRLLQSTVSFGPQFAKRDEQIKGATSGSSWYASVFLVVNAALGAGLLNFPQAYDAAGGVLVAVIVQAVFMVFIVVALILLGYCSDVNQSATYQDVVYSMCGKAAQNVCSLCIVVYCYGTCITFFIIIGDQLDRFFYFISGADFCHYWYMDRKFTMTLSSVILILPMCFPKRIDFLKYSSFFGVVGIAYVVLLIFIKYFTSGITPGHIKTKPDNFMDMFLVVPVICFGYQCHVSVVPIYSCLEKRNVKEFSKCVGVAILICVLTYTLAAAFGYLTFGSNVDADILKSYQPTPEVLIGVFLIAAKTYTTYPILSFCGRAAFMSVWIHWCCLTPDQIVSGEKSRRVLVTLVWFVTSLVLAVFIPNIGAVISVLGGLAAVFIFVFPGMCLLQVGYLKEAELARWKVRTMKGMAVAFIVLGAFIFGVTTTQSVSNDVISASSPRIVHNETICT
ncbi:sodium-coupled neutral amino acid transporter 7-like isoform X2 [Lineus longissimus]|uniref:sodium-coupled neutral amino acid transporter 7-like isoform X2 n=1 Tax=Lineus longissimus TaxID=88925 RepID=UPI00315C6C5C